MTLQQLKYVTTVAQTGTISDAAKKLFISQPSLTKAVRELEKEMGITIFERTNRGIVISKEGETFLGYARQVLEQAALLEETYKKKAGRKQEFSVSTQHYSFAVNAFVELIERYGSEKYDFCLRETQTYEIIEDVAQMKSEIGILYLNDFNRTILEKLIKEHDLVFTELFVAKPHIFVSTKNPLAGKKSVTIEELEPYPYLSFEQGDNSSFYLAEELLPTNEYSQIIHANDRATMLNLMIGLNGYTLCSGIMCEELNGSDYCAVKLKSDEIMTIGYISRKGVPISPLGKKYLEEISKYKDKALR